MIPRLALLTLLISAAATHAAEVVTAGPWELHSSFWMSLHQRLISDAMLVDSRELTGLSPEDAATWAAAVDAYREAGDRSDLTFAKPMVITTDVLTQVADDATELLVDCPLTGPLTAAAPVYRRHGWTEDDRANRFFLRYAAAMLREAGEPLIRRHEAVYRTAWPALVRAYVTPEAGPYGAYTMHGLAGGVITTMSSRDEGYQGLRALEMLLHEASHAIVGPNRGTVAEAIKAAAKARDAPLPRDLWHAILFATTSELTRRALAERGVTTFVPSSVDLFSRAWPHYRAAVETHWLPYLDGEGTLETAIDAIVGDLVHDGREGGSAD